MSLQVILDAICASGEAQIREVESHANTRAREILANAELEAEEAREEACAMASAPAGRERARILHRAHLESLHIRGNVREALVEATLDQTRGRLANLRAEHEYPAVLRRLAEEALAELDGSPEETGKIILEADPRDQMLLSKILTVLGLILPVKYTLNCWGGVVARSDDGQVVVINTLEVRLERAIPYLRRYLASVYEDEQFEADAPEGQVKFAAP
jgi:V/A-type H+-transporting ATPase subunit E